MRLRSYKKFILNTQCIVQFVIFSEFIAIKNRYSLWQCDYNAKDISSKRITLELSFYGCSSVLFALANKFPLITGLTI